MKLFLALCILLLAPTATFAEELNAGIVHGLWYASPKVFADTPTRIYVALRNYTDKDLTGTVRFSVDGTKVGSAYVSALSGRIIEAWADWTPTYGEHVIQATLEDVKLSSIGKPSEFATVTSILAEDTIFADRDTDKDGIGDEEDDDDDNDTISDSDEIVRGTNPRIADPLPQNTSGEDSDQSQSSQGDVTNGSDGNLAQANTAESAGVSVASGLEQYLPEGRTRALASLTTEKVNALKDSLDTYRTERKRELDSYFEKDPPADDTPPSTDVATITRSQIEPQGKSFWGRTIDAGKAIITGLYTLILWITSTILGHPAIVELLLLLFIIILVYRTARRFGRRPRGYT